MKKYVKPALAVLTLEPNEALCTTCDNTPATDAGLFEQLEYLLGSNWGGYFVDRDDHCTEPVPEGFFEEYCKFTGEDGQKLFIS